MAAIASVKSATLDSMIALATRLAYLSCFSCSTGSPLLITGPPNAIEEVVVAFDFCGLGADGTTDIHAGDKACARRGRVRGTRGTIVCGGCMCQAFAEASVG